MQNCSHITAWKWLACAFLALTVLLPSQVFGQTGGRSNKSPGISVEPPGGSPTGRPTGNGN